jgi:hypothetical protein
LPLAKAYRLSGGRLKFEVLDSTFTRTDTDEDLSGWEDAVGGVFNFVKTDLMFM